MSTSKNEDKSPSNNKDDEMDRLARQMLLDEAKRNKIRAETQGALGWRKPTLVTNRKFLCNTLISNAVHNINKNEQERQRRMKTTVEQKHDEHHTNQRKRSSSEKRHSSTTSRESSSSKRTKKDK